MHRLARSKPYTDLNTAIEWAYQRPIDPSRISLFKKKVFNLALLAIVTKNERNTEIPDSFNL